MKKGILLNNILLFVLCGNLFGNDHLTKYSFFLPIQREGLQSDFNIKKNNTMLVTKGNHRQYENESVELEPEGLKWNFHKITGYATLATGVSAIISGFTGGEERPHCGLAVTSTALAVTSVCNGIYMYRKKIDTSDGKKKNKIHAIGSFMSTIGFLSVSLFPPERKVHGPISTISGAAFIISTGILYF